MTRGAGETEGRSARWAGELAERARRLMEEHQLPGLAIAVARAGRTLWEEGLGFADRERGIPATPDTAFGIASASKPFTALAVLLLDEAGALSVDDPVARWLPELTLPHPDDRVHRGAITLHHLLTHTSGLPAEQAFVHARVAAVRSDPDLARVRPPPHGASWGDLWAMETASTYEELLALNARMDYRLLAPPGTCFSYSNEGYAFLAAVVERASGERFPEYVRARVLEPLGLSGTAFQEGESPPGLAQVYAAGEGGAFASPHWHGTGRIYGGGGMVSTVRDLVRFLDLFRTGGEVAGRRLLSAEGVRRMTWPHAALPGGRAYGYGFFVQPHHGVTLVEHGGGNKGIGASIALVPQAGLTVAVLSNLRNEAVREVQLVAVGLALGLPTDAERSAYPEVPLPPERLAGLAGAFGSPLRGHPRTALELAFFGEEGVLKVKRGEEWVAVRPIAEDAVLVPSRAGGEPVRFLLDGDGTAVAASHGQLTFARL